ncbi:MAG TPA: peptide chain release factor N(5)-glutamine methyltransferase [Candidatus Limiplasma sp.]|nr:peptide chain release factor N(5)-glutamine methyltransferase [Candidatus Limiplasma sp.]HRX07808.1 peptide chain release factor N(5)-glutamine methyltransferase [Candidatus Limiplasma sp.]
MTILEALRLGTDTLAEVPDPRVDAELLLGDALHMPRMTLGLNPAQPLTPAQEQAYLAMLQKRKAREPLQYILGTQHFFGVELVVNPAVLIPRPETETLCELALARLKPLQSPVVADICTGSGAIAIALKTARPDANVWATDLSPAALSVAQDNAKRNGAAITFLQGDLMEPLQGKTFDCILSNPPYIKAGDLHALQPEVRREPRMALDGGQDGLTFYRRLAQDAHRCLKRGGILFAELGDGQAQAVSGLFEASGFTGVRVHNDLFGKPRVLEALLFP